jgi:hypothetical protein
MNVIILKGAALRQPPLPQSGPRAKTIAHPCTSVSHSDGSFFLLFCYGCELHVVLCFQEGELDVEEGRDLLQEPPCVATSVTPADAGLGKDQTPPSKGHRLPTLKLANPFSKRKVSSHSGRISAIILRKRCSCYS